MADVQLENGFTKIANQLLDAIQNFQFTQNQFKLLILIWRNTYGWSRKECELSLSYIEKNTHLDRKRASTTLQDLIKANVILEIDKGSSTKPKVVTFNKNYMEWEIKQYKGSDIPTTSSHSDTSGKVTTSSSGELTTSGSGHSATHKRNILNKSLNKDTATIYNARGESDGVPTTGQNGDPVLSGEISQTSEDAVQIILDRFIQLRAYGFSCSPNDVTAAKEILNAGVSVSDALIYLKERFDTYTPKHPRDRINSLAYCTGFILDRHHEALEKKKEGERGAQIHQYRPSNGRTRSKGKTTEEIYRELEESKRAWGG